MDSGTYIERRIQDLGEHSERLRNVHPEEVNDFDTWSGLKLILHSAVVNMYTSVHQSQGTGDIFYIDALAGSGVSTYDEGKSFIGSPLVALSAAQKPFTKMYFIESNEGYAEALEARLQTAFSLPEFTEPENYEVIPGNANDEIPSIMEEICELGEFDTRYNYYCFIDNQGLDVNWSTISEMTPKPYGDLLVNSPTSQIGRCANQESYSALNSYYGKDMSRIASGPTSRETFLNEYIKQLKSRNRSVVRSTRVDTGKGSFYYDMLYGTRKTGGSNGYVNVIDYVKRFVEVVDSHDVTNILDVLEGDQQSIEDFLPSSEDVEEVLPTDETERGRDQRGLGEFS